MKTIIETITITPTKEMPLEVFRACYHKAYFMELMEHLPDGRVMWDDEVSDIVSEDAADIEYYALQNDLYTSSMELPKAFFESTLS